MTYLAVFKFLLHFYNDILIEPLSYFGSVILIKVRKYINIYNFTDLTFS